MVHINFWWYTDDDDILCGSVHNMKKNAEAVVVASKDIGLAVNPNKTKCISMSRYQNAG